MKKRQERLDLHDVAMIIAWNRNMEVGDDTAYIALLRLLKFVEYALSVLEAPTAPIDSVDEEK